MLSEEKAYCIAGNGVTECRYSGVFFFTFNYDFVKRMLLRAHHSPDMYLGDNIIWNFNNGIRLWSLLCSITKRLQAFLISLIEIFSTYFKAHLHNQQLRCRHVKLTEVTRDTALVDASLVLNQKCFQYINPLTPNTPYRGRTTPLTSKVAYYIFIQQI